MIAVHNVSKRFGDFAALDDVSIDVESGSLTALLGPSGSGKSTLLRIIAGLEQPDTGSVDIEGRDVTTTPPQRRGIGFVFQHYAAFKHMSVRDNVAFGLKIRREPKPAIAARVDELLEIVGLTGWATRYPGQLSGASAWRSPARWRCRRACCCSTSRSARSTPTCAPSCASGCAACTTRCT
jgi:sulfate/thiosulfate transport system ATP-binding protein